LDQKGTLQDVTRLDIVSASLESLITLSKRIFHVQDPESYENAYQHLEDASTLVNEFYVGFGVKVAKERTLDLWRCLSGAFWNLGSSLYQAGRWDHSVPYISKSVDIDKILLDAGWSTSENMNNNWTVFFEQMPKRAMLLATCFIKMNNRQVRNFPGA
jgi:separase